MARVGVLFFLDETKETYSDVCCRSSSKAVLLYYYFTTALLLLYYCFTTALLGCVLAQEGAGDI